MSDDLILEAIPSIIKVSYPASEEIHCVTSDIVCCLMHHYLNRDKHFEPYSKHRTKFFTDAIEYKIVRYISSNKRFYSNFVNSFPSVENSAYVERTEHINGEFIALIHMKHGKDDIPLYKHAAIFEEMFFQLFYTFSALAVEFQQRGNANGPDLAYERVAKTLAQLKNIGCIGNLYRLRFDNWSGDGFHQVREMFMKICCPET